MAKVELLAITPNSEKLIEQAGRTCYKSLDKISDESYKKFIRMIVRSGHHSVLEHAYATFKITGGSRTFTHQIVRHRHCAFSQQSQRYVNEDQFSIVTPESIATNYKANEIFDNFIKDSNKVYAKLVGLGIRKEDARFALPNAVQSEIVLSANFRELRHIIDERLTKEAQWEIRDITKQMLTLLKDAAPTVFEDYEA